MNASEFIAQFLNKRGVKNVFMLSGTGSIYLDDAFAHQKGMRYICARHEAAAVGMASAYSKLLNDVGVVIATTGPGGTNAISGVAEAWVDSAPVLVISGQVGTQQLSEKVRTFGIQGFNIIENVKHITKYAVRVDDPNDIQFHLEKAIHKATTGRPGPVWLDIPFDIQSKEVDMNNLKEFRPFYFDKEKSTLKLDKALTALRNSEKPLIVFGQGVRTSDSIEELRFLMNELRIPAISARMANDILTDQDECYFGMGGIRGNLSTAEIMKECDLVLALGTSLTHAQAGPEYDYFKSMKNLIMVNIDKKEITKKGLKVDFPFNVDLKLFLTEFNNKIKETVEWNRYSGWLDTCKEYEESNPIVTSEHSGNPINSYHFLDKVSKHAKDNAVFVSDAGSSNYAVSQTLKMKEGQRDLTSGAFYSMGLAVPLSIGASATQPDSQVITIVGDGSIELNIQELRTISYNDLNVKTFVINNGGYASIRKSQDDMTGARYTDDDTVLNFEKVAAAFELPFYIIEDYDNIDSDLKNIFANDKPMLIEVVCDCNQKIVEPFGGNV